MFKVTSILSVAITFLTLTFSTAQAKYWIESLEGKQDGYSILRENKALSPSPLMGLQEGDKIIVKDKAGQIKIFSNGKKTTLVTVKNSPFIIPTSAKAPRIWDVVFSQIKAAFTPAPDQYPEMVSKGVKTVKIGASSPKDNFLFYKADQLYLSWNPQKELTSIKIIDESGKRLYQQEKIQNNHLSLKDFPKAKKFSVQISAPSSQNKVAPSQITVQFVEKNKLPRGVREILAMNFPKEAEKYALVGVLSQLPQWRFQAYQLAKKYGFENAARRFEQGRYVKRP